MNTCHECKHWNPKATDTNMLRFGFARCDRKPLPGHTLSAKASACKDFRALEADKVQARVTWLKQRKAIA